MEGCIGAIERQGPRHTIRRAIGGNRGNSSRHASLVLLRRTRGRRWNLRSLHSTRRCRCRIEMGGALGRLPEELIHAQEIIFSPEVDVFSGSGVVVNRRSMNVRGSCGGIGKYGLKTLYNVGGTNATLASPAVPLHPREHDLPAAPPSSLRA